LKLNEVSVDDASFCSPDTPVADIVKILRKKFIRAVFVGDPENILGIVSDQIIFKNISEGKDLVKMKAKDIMRFDCQMLDINASIEEAYRKSAKNPCRVYAVKREGKVIGEISKKRIALLYNDIKKNEIFDLEKRIKSIKM